MCLPAPPLPCMQSPNTRELIFRLIYCVQSTENTHIMRHLFLLTVHLSSVGTGSYKYRYLCKNWRSKKGGVYFQENGMYL